MAIGTGEAAAIAASLKNVSRIVQRLRHSCSLDELRAGVKTLTEILMNAYVAVLDLAGEKARLVDERAVLHARIAGLEREIVRLSEFDECSGKYERVQMASGMYFYRETSQMGIGAPALLCPTCFHAKRISILQRWDKGLVKCYPCDARFAV
jgi:hypothetical protein